MERASSLLNTVTQQGYNSSMKQEIEIICDILKKENDFKYGSAKSLGIAHVYHIMAMTCLDKMFRQKFLHWDIADAMDMRGLTIEEHVIEFAKKTLVYSNYELKYVEFMAHIYRFADETEKSTKMYEMLYNKNPNQSLASKLGESYRDMNNTEKSIYYYKKSIDQHSLIADLLVPRFYNNYDKAVSLIMLKVGHFWLKKSAKSGVW